MKSEQPALVPSEQISENQSTKNLKTSQNTTNSNQPNGFLNGMSVYGLEFAVAMIMLLVMVSVLSGLAYALFGFINSPNTSSGGGYAALWFAASTIVWLPILIIFYARSRGHMLRNPTVTNDVTQRVFVILYQVVMVLMGVGFAVATVYTFLIAFTLPNETGSLLLTGTVPGLISSLFALFAFFAFFRRPIISRKIYTSLLLAITLLIIIPAMVVGIIGQRNVNANINTRSIQNQYRNHDRYYEHDSYDQYKDDRYY